MKHLAALVFVVACEKSGPVEATPGSSTTGVAETPKPTKVLAETPKPVVDAGVATLPSDAAKVASVDAKPSNTDAALSDEEMLAMVNVLAFEGDTGTAGDMSPRRPGADLARQIDNVRDSGRKVDVGGGDPNKGPTGRVSVSKKQAFDDTSLTPDAVLAKMRAAYMAGIKRCYKSYLKKDPSARGKVRLTFTVNETGRSVSPKAAGFATEVDTCLSGVMANWRFQIPKDKDGEATDAAFGFELQLVPD